jgi:hypothetical protein
MSLAASKRVLRGNHPFLVPWVRERGFAIQGRLSNRQKRSIKMLGNIFSRNLPPKSEAFRQLQRQLSTGRKHSKASRDKISNSLNSSEIFHASRKSERYRLKSKEASERSWANSGVSRYVKAADIASKNFKGKPSHRKGAKITDPVVLDRYRKASLGRKQSVETREKKRESSKRGWLKRKLRPVILGLLSPEERQPLLEIRLKEALVFSLDNYLLLAA